MTSETAPTEAATSRPSTGEPSLGAPDGLTRAQWRRLRAEAELAAKVAAAPASDVACTASVEPEPDLAAPAADAVDEELVLTVVDTDAHAGPQLVTPSRRRRERAQEPETTSSPGESFGPAAVEPDEPSAGVESDIPPAAPLPDDRVVDEFEFAARLFSFTAQTPVQVAAEAIVEQEAREVATPRRRLRNVGKRMAAASVSMTAVAAVGLLSVGLTSPAAVVFASGDTGRDITAETARPAASVEPEEIQAFVSSSATGVTFDRSDAFDVTSVSEIAADSGVTNFAGTWVNDPNAEIQWPFPVGVPISAAFGSVSYLSEFSRPHRGVDLTPGAGADIHAVAGGTVRIATEAGGDYGVTVVIDHTINGELVSTRYGHMQYGSLNVKVGETIEPGEVIGKVGSTGKSTGAHLHLEVLLGGTTQVDPIAWLQEHAGS
ncbi:peptidoglycan DD-metalloendopeptidase family protein [Microbacterium sp. NM3R9]|uniref:peptidoglycan DD-metalloendopeptidase family protein n=1 Tax=Microbacterium thalli TaxID=3027921 RepID=UPI0023650522|nr:peptidoglycan DD-metalloendopeptidase family protein [Microbacterium thalli]MDN8548200.1 peptidoglycan DD-metalloendopeptidase family protein [Microbacterium thalli]